MKLKIWLIISAVITLLMLLVVVLVGRNILPWATLHVGMGSLANPHKPEITYGEFPFKLEYEIDGQKVEVEDVLICKFSGFGVDAGRGKYRKWVAQFASGNTRITILQTDDIEIFYTPGLPSSRIAGVYMGDEEYYPGDAGSSYPDAWYTNEFQDKVGNAYIISADEMWQKYRIKLISWEARTPIKNTFKDK